MSGEGFWGKGGWMRGRRWDVELEKGREDGFWWVGGGGKSKMA